MNDADRIRQNVSETYAKAVTSESGCCCGSPVQKGTVAKLAGYTREELEALPPEAVVNSFGCGNPLALAQIAEGDVVLDLGSGAGIDILLAGKKVGATGRVIGVDMTDEMIAKASENIAASGMTHLEVRKGLIEDLPVDSDSVDWVISNCVINLSPDKPKVFAELARVLKPGGRMNVSDIVVQDMPDSIRRNEALYSSCVSGAVSEEEYLAGLRAAGLEEVGVQDRLVYDESQLKGFLENELPTDKEAAAAPAGGCCGQATCTPTLKDVAKVLTGKVWSARFTAKKPTR